MDGTANLPISLVTIFVDVKTMVANLLISTTAINDIRTFKFQNFYFYATILHVHGYNMMGHVVKMRLEVHK